MGPLFGAGAGGGAGAGAGAATAGAGPLKHTKPEVEALRELFGREMAGVQKLIDRLQGGENVPIPAGATPEVLDKYRQIAEQAIKNGRDSQGVQAARIKAIDILLGRR